jgi:hypothetical protein
MALVATWPRPGRNRALTRAVFAAHLATSLPPRCHFVAVFATILPLLPSIMRNVKWQERANRLEFGIRAEDAPDTRPKSGKNGNVDLPSQHCRPNRVPTCRYQTAVAQVVGLSITRAEPGLPLAFMPGRVYHTSASPRGGVRARSGIPITPPTCRHPAPLRLNCQIAKNDVLTGDVRFSGYADRVRIVADISSPRQPSTSLCVPPCPLW